VDFNSRITNATIYLLIYVGTRCKRAPEGFGAKLSPFFGFANPKYKTNFPLSLLPKSVVAVMRSVLFFGV